MPAIKRRNKHESERGRLRISMKLLFDQTNFQTSFEVSPNVGVFVVVATPKRGR